MRKLARDCPTDLIPRWSVTEGAYMFKDSAAMYMAGVNNGNADDLRGNESDEIIIDEAGQIDELDYLVSDVAMPQLLDMDGIIVAGRKLIISGTPPRTPAHEFTSICEKAEVDGNYFHLTIYEAGYTPEVIEIFKKEAGGEHSSTWKREYLAQRVVDEESAIIPEWKEEYERVEPRDDLFQFHLKYESLDVGVVRDFSACLFGYYDFPKAKIFIEDEYVINGPKMTTEILARGIKEKEKEVFTDHKVYKRVSDVDQLLIQDLSIMHGLPFFATDKGYLEEMVNQVRILVNAGRIVVNPKCKQLIGCLRYGVWDERKIQFARSKAYGHFDALASLVYFVRNVDYSVNPIPMHYGKDVDNTFFMKPEKKNKTETFRKAFNQEGIIRNERTLKKGPIY